MTWSSLPRIDLGRGVHFAPALLLAPMEGVTDPAFRGLILDCNAAGSVGAACTEFLRVSQLALPARRIAEELGPARRDVPVGVQLMGNDAALLAASAVHAASVGAAYVDLNFGCPAPRVFQHCAGSALLEDPPRLERLVAAVAAACPAPVTVKLRAGVRDDARLEELVQRAEQAGAAALTLHARLRIESYEHPADWSRIARAVRATRIPVIGNGSADTPQRVDALFAATGCAGVMVGRGALQNPWLFEDWRRARAGSPPRRRSPAAVFAWLREYAGRMQARGAPDRAAVGRLKQAAKALARSGLLPASDVLRKALRETDLEGFFAALGGASGCPSMVPR